jgi:TonB family protein
MTTAVAVLVDTSIITALGLLVCLTLRRKAAALRHMILAASLVAAAAVPLLETTVPHWEFAVLPASQVTSSGVVFSSESGADVSLSAGIADPQRLTWTGMLVAVWGIGFMAVMAGLLAGVGRLAWLTRRWQPIPSSRWRVLAENLSQEYALKRPVVVLESPQRALLLTWGLFRPRIVVPTGAAAWSDDRIRIVLAHELAHIVRGDWAVHVAAEVVRAAYWFNPLVWLTCRRLRDESEQACDDMVLRRGIPAADYASHLLAVARQLLTSGRGWAMAPAIASSSTLERRIAAMLNPSRNREPLTRRATMFALLIMLAVAAPLAAVTVTERIETTTMVISIGGDVALAAAPPPVVVGAVAVPVPRRHVITASAQQTKPAAAQQNAAAAAQQKPAPAAQQKPASLSGTLRDASGAVLPGVELTLTDVASGTRYSKNSDAGGKFEFRDLPPSQYELTARLAGFASLRVELTLAAGESAERLLTLRVGGLQETVTVTCAPAGASVPGGGPPSVLAFDAGRVMRSVFWTPGNPPRITPVTFAAQAGPIRVGGQIRAPKRTKDVPPTCPAGVALSGVVILEATIGVDGKVTDVKVLRSIPQLDQSAIDAVRQWEFTPTLLNGSPTPVIMVITATYTTK